MLNILDDVPETNYFYVTNGMVIKNLNDLCAILDLIDKKVFDKHVNKEKNDFANWARHVYQDDKFADELEKAKTRNSMLKKVKDYVKDTETEEQFLNIFDTRIPKFIAGLIIGILLGLSFGIFIIADFL